MSSRWGDISSLDNFNVFRLVEEVKEKCGGVSLSNEDVYMSTTYKDFVKITVLKSRGVSLKKPFNYDAVSVMLLYSLC